MAAKDVPLASLTRLRGEELSKKRAAEEMERIELMGQESDIKAQKWVREDFEQREKKEQNEFYQDMEILHGLRKNAKAYGRYLVQVFLKFASEEAIPKKYSVSTDLDDKGIVIRIDKTRYTGAFAVSGLPTYDHMAAKLMAVKLGNTVAKLEGFMKTTEGGIVLPDEEDVKLYGTS